MGEAIGTAKRRTRVISSGGWLVVLMSFVSLLPSCAANSSTDLAPDASTSTVPAMEQRIVALVRDWFAVLESEDPEAGKLERFLARSSFELSLVGEETLETPVELEAWRANLHSTHPRLEYRLDPIAVELVDSGLFRAHFELERRAVDSEGIPHIARREHDWLVRDVPGGAPVILRIDERPLLAFPGTGPQVVCY